MARRAGFNQQRSRKRAAFKPRRYQPARTTLSNVKPTARNSVQVPAAPAAPARYAPPPAGPDSAFMAQQAWANQERERVRGRYGSPDAGAGAGFAQRYGSEGENAARRYGLESGYDNNPFSLAKQMERAYQQNREGTTNRVAASGGLYSGSMDRQLGEVDTGYAQQSNDLRTGYQGELGRITGEASEALAALDRGDVDAYTELVNRLQSQEPMMLAPPQEAQPGGFMWKPQGPPAQSLGQEGPIDRDGGRLFARRRGRR